MRFNAVGARKRLAARRAGIACALVAGLAMAPAAHAYTFGEPGVRATGPEVRVFDYSTQRCHGDDIPDQPTRAFRNAAGNVILINTHHHVRRYVGGSLATVAKPCPGTIMLSGVSRDPSLYDDREWLASTYTHNGTTVYGLIHAEYQGWQDGGCGTSFEDRKKCWYNAVTLTRSDDGGASFSHAPAPTHYVAGPPYRYSPGIGPIGFFQPSNIVRGHDGMYYVLVHVEGHGAQPTGSCLWRTSDLADRRSWRAWGGTAFDVEFRDPYVHSYDPAEGVCALISRNQIGTRSESLTWSTYLKKWVLVGSANNADGVSGPGFYYHTSDDLINWTRGKLLMQGPLPWAYQCGGPEVLRDPSVLDNDSKSRNFETIGQRPYLFFTRFHLNGCAWSLDRDLIRMPLEFSNRQPGGPVAALGASTTSPRTGETVTFDASGSRDDDGSIVRYVWDLDGDGAYELSTGTDPRAGKAYGAQDKVTVTLRVCDDDGKATDETILLNVSGEAVSVPGSPGGPTSAVCPSPAGGGGGGDPPGGDPPSGDPPGEDPPGGDPPPDPTGALPPAAADPPAGGPAGGGATQGASSPAPPAATVVAGSPPGLLRVVGRPRTRRDGRVVLRVRVPAAGVLTVRGLGRRPAISRSRRSASRARTLTVRVRVSRAGRALLRKKRRAKVRMLLVFRPVGGPSQRAKRSLTLRAKRR